MSKLFLVVGLLSLVGCASIHKGEYAKQVDEDGSVKKGNVTNSGIIVSGSEVSSLASKHFTQLDFTFENTTNQWIEIDKVNISYMDKKLNKLVKVPLGKKLMMWSEAAKQNKVIADHNRSVLIGAIAGVAAVGGAVSKNYRARGAAAAVLSASAGALAYNELKDKINDAELAKIVPKSHLLNTPLYIPPGLHAKRWIAIYLKNPYKSPYLSQVKISYRVGKKKRESILLPLRKANTSSSFQNRYHTHWKKINDEKRKKEEGYRPF